VKTNDPPKWAAQQAPPTVARPAAIPAVVVVRPLEGRELVRLVCQTYEEELRLRAEYEGRRAA
jgi:hypothetical protein